MIALIGQKDMGIKMKYLIATYPSGGKQFAYDTEANRRRAATAYARLGFNYLVGFEWPVGNPYGLSIRAVPGAKFRREDC